MGTETTRRMVITAVTVGMSQSEAARAYGVSQWVSRLMARYQREGPTAFTPRSRRPRTSPNQTSEQIIAKVLELRTQLLGQGLDAGAETIRASPSSTPTPDRSSASSPSTPPATINPSPKRKT